MDAVRRVDAVRVRLSDEGLQAMLVCDPANVAYLTGFEGVFDGEPAHAVVIAADTLAIYSDSRYEEALRTRAAGSAWDVRIPARNLYDTLCTELAGSGVTALGIEESVPHGRFRFVSERFGGQVVAVDQWVEEVRQSKDPEEIRRIAAAQDLTDLAFEMAVDLVAEGAVERDVALELEVFMRRHGSDGVAFPPIVASGPNSALPHARATGRVIQRGDFVKMDFGARIDGYCADMTRTVVVGPASERQREVYEAVLAANLAGIAAVRAGVPGSVVDGAARAVLVERGLGETFRHSTGHGVGLDVHELPAVGPAATKSLVPGAVITVEPGSYLPGFGGVRIEDLVVVEDGGARVLSRTPKALLEL